MSQEQRRKITTITSTKSSYGASTSRSAFGYWIPLAITVTAATVALGAWIWSERSDEEESESETEQFYASSNKPGGNAQSSGISGAAAAAGAAGLGAAAGYSSMSGGLPPGPGPAGAQPPPGAYTPQPPVQGGFQGPPPGPPGPSGPGAAASFYREESSRDVQTNTQQDDGFIARMSNAVGLTRGDAPGRTNFSGGGWASTSLAAAAGSVVGAAVNAVRGNADDRDQHFSDQEKWSEEADKPDRVASPRKSAGSLLAAGAAGAALGAAADRRDESSRGLVRTGTAAEFYSGAIDAPRRSSVLAAKRKTVAIIVSAVDNPADRQEVDTHQVSSFPIIANFR